MDMPLASPFMKHVIIYSIIFFTTLFSACFFLRNKLSWKICIGILPFPFLLIIYIIFYLFCNFIGRIEVRSQFAKMHSLGIATNINQLIPKNRESTGNGALLYEAAFKVMQSSDIYKLLDDPILKDDSFDMSKLSPEKQSSVETFLNSQNSKIIFLFLREGNQKPFAVYSYEYAGLETLLPMMNEQLKLFRLLTLKISSEAVTRDKEKIYLLINDGFKMLKQFENDLFLVSHLVNIRCYHINIACLKHILEKYGIDNVNASILLNTLNTANLKQGAVKGIEGDIYAIGYDVFERILKEKPFCQNEDISYNQKILIKCTPFFYQEYSCYLNYMINQISFIRKPYWTVHGKIKNLNSDFMHKPFCQILRHIIVPDTVATKTAKCETEINAAKITLALHIYKNNHGQFPEKLDALAPEILKEIPLDPFNGKPFEYNKKGDYFKLSSDWLAEKEKNIKKEQEIKL